MSFKIALFGGSFDPVHLGHVKMLEYCLDHFDFDQIDIIPAKLSPFKKDNLFSSEQRLELLQETFLHVHKKVKINDTELKREGPSYTSLTLQEYKNEYPNAKLFLLIGSDNISKLKEWKDFDYLKDNLEFVIFNRPEFRIDAQLDGLGIKYNLINNFEFSISSSDIKKQLKNKNMRQIESSRLFDGLIPINIQGLILKYYSN